MQISIPQFLLESSFCLASFYALFHLLLRRETFFQLNRAYLLLMPLVSLVIPLANISLSTNAPSSKLEVFYPIMVEAQQFQLRAWEQIESPTPAFSLSLADLLLGFYVLGVAFMSFMLARGLWRLFGLIRRSRREQEGELTFLQPMEEFPAASFFSYIFWKGEEIPETKRIILEHELVHVRQRHSLDVLLMELWVIIKWFNPLIYLYRRSLQATHEYIADRYVARQLGSAYQYATFLASHNLQGSCHPLTNTFAAYLRRRLAMLGQRDSSRWRAGKYLLCLPLLGTLMALFSFNLSDQLPADSLRRAGGYLQELGTSTILELSEESQVEHPGWNGLIAPDQLVQAQPYYMSWGGQDISLLWLGNPDHTREHYFPINDLSYAAFQELGSSLPELWHNHTPVPIQILALAVEENGQTVYSCEELDFDNPQCFVSTTSKARPGQHLILIFKDLRGEAYTTRIALVQEGQRPGVVGPMHLSAFSRQKVAEYSRREVVEARTPKPLFRQSGKVLRWGDNQAFFIRREPPEAEKAIVSLSLEAFQRMLGTDITLLDGRYPRLIKRLWAIRMFHPENKEWEAILFDSVKDWDGKGPYRLETSQQEKVRTFLEQGFRKASFSILYDDPAKEMPGSLELEVWIGRNPPGEEPLFPEEGVVLNPAGVYPYQYINRPGKRSLIKMDTTVERYRWMYDDYKNGKKLDVVHIPGFRTIRRAVTLVDVILPEPEIGKVELLIQDAIQAEQLSEYHDFSGQKVYLFWRGKAGVADKYVISLSEFKSARETGLGLRVGETVLPLRQVELLLVPASGPATKFITDSVMRPEIQRAIVNLQARSSIFVTNIVIEGEQRPLLFPLTFAFNLR